MKIIIGTARKNIFALWGRQYAELFLFKKMFWEAQETKNSPFTLIIKERVW
ncbi:MAG TPA: hypothetical protein ACHBX0_09875 [Arsenophonus sp.]